MISLCLFTWLPSPVAARSKAYVWDRSLAEIAGSNPPGDMNVCLWIYQWTPWMIRQRVCLKHRYHTIKKESQITKDCDFYFGKISLKKYAIKFIWLARHGSINYATRPDTDIADDGLIYNLFNPLNPNLNPICYLLALLEAHHFLHVRRIRVKSLTFRRLMSYIYGAPILDVSTSHTTTQHSR